MYTDAEWKMLDAKARFTIRLHLAESVYFMIVGEPTTKVVEISYVQTMRATVPAIRFTL